MPCGLWGQRQCLPRNGGARMVPLGLLNRWQHLPCNRGGAPSVAWPHGRRQRLSHDGEVHVVPHDLCGVWRWLFREREVHLAPLGLCGWRQRLSLRQGSACGAARPSWLAAAPGSALGAQPGQERTQEVKCFLERLSTRAGGAQRLSPCWWRRRVLTMGHEGPLGVGVPKSPVTGSNAWRAPSTTLVVRR